MRRLVVVAIFILGLILFSYPAVAYYCDTHSPHLQISKIPAEQDQPPNGIALLYTTSILVNKGQTIYGNLTLYAPTSSLNTPPYTSFSFEFFIVTETNYTAWQNQEAQSHISGGYPPNSVFVSGFPAQVGVIPLSNFSYTSYAPTSEYYNTNTSPNQTWIIPFKITNASATDSYVFAFFDDLQNGQPFTPTLKVFVNNIVYPSNNYYLDVIIPIGGGILWLIVGLSSRSKTNPLEKRGLLPPREMQ